MGKQKKTAFGQAMAPRQRTNMEPRDPQIPLVHGNWANWSMVSPGPLLSSSRNASKPDVLPKRDPPVIYGFDTTMAPAQRPLIPTRPQDEFVETQEDFVEDIPASQRPLLRVAMTQTAPAQPRSPQDTLDFLRKRQGMPREVLGQTTMEDRSNQGAMAGAFRSGDFSGTDAGQYARPSELDAISRLIQSTRNQNPPRPNITPPAAQPGQPGFGESYYAGQSNVTVPGVGRRASNQSLGAGRVGTGIQSTGMTTGGVFGSGLMMGGAALPAMVMGAAPPRQQPELASRPMQYGSEITPSQFAEAWKTRKMTTGDSPDLDKMTKRRQALEARQAAVQARGIARGQGREERMQFARDAQYFGPRGALIRAFARQGVEPERAMAMMQGNMQWLSEDNRQRRAADEFSGRTAIEQERNAIERDRLNAEIEQAQGQQSAAMGQSQMAGQSAYDQAEGTELDKIRAGQAASGDPNWKPIKGPRRAPAGSTSGVPQAQIDALRAAGNTAQADALEEQNRRLEEARRRAGWGGMRGVWDDWWAGA